MHILDAIGNTSLVRLRNVVPPTSAGVLVKLEWENPTGSSIIGTVSPSGHADGGLRPEVLEHRSLQELTDDGSIDTRSRPPGTD
jgi:hypothetical protein